MLRTLVSSIASRSAVPGGLIRSLRSLHATAAIRHGDFEKKDPTSPDQVVVVNIVDRDGNNHTVRGKVGDNLLYLLHRYQSAEPKIALEGACEASLACSTCHVIVDDAFFDKLPEASEAEEDMLDKAACLTASSRLGCQITLSRELDGLKVQLPKYSANFYVDGHVPTPH